MLEPIPNAGATRDFAAHRWCDVKGRRNFRKDFTRSNSVALILVRTCGAVCVHCIGVGHGTIRDSCNGGTIVGFPAGAGSAGVAGTWRLFARWWIRRGRLIPRGIVSATGKEHYGNEWNDFIHGFRTFVWLTP